MAAPRELLQGAEGPRARLSRGRWPARSRSWSACTRWRSLCSHHVQVEGNAFPQPLVSAVSLLCFLPLSGNSGRYFPETGRQAVRAQSKVFPRAPRERACRESLRGSQGGPPPPEKVLLSPGGLGTERQQLGQGHPGGDCPHAKGQPPPTLEPRDSEGLSEQNAAQRTLPTQLTSGPGQKRPAFPWTHKSRGPSTPLQPWHPGVGRRRHDEGATALESPVSSPQTGKPVQ